EMTDIGGPTMIRSAAKGNRVVVCTELDRVHVINMLKKSGDVDPVERNELAALAELYIAEYCLASTTFRSGGYHQGFTGIRVAECLYGENAWQNPAGLYAGQTADPLALSQFVVKAGTSPSYNNWVDVDRLIQTVTHIAATFDVNQGRVPFIAVAVKHGNACGAAVGDDQIAVLQKMVTGDLEAIFGGLVMTNFPINHAEAEVLLSYGVTEGRRILDAIIAPAFGDDAIDLLKRYKDKCRFLVNPALATLTKESLDTHPRFRYVRGGFLLQPNYTYIFDIFDIKDPELQVFGSVTEDQLSDLLLAKAICDTSNSNTITIVKGKMLIGNGTGQQHRGWAAQLAVDKAFRNHHNTGGATAASDSFFPFDDGPKILIMKGISVIMATSGSKKDEHIKQVLGDAGVTFITLPDTKARGFFGH
ncbi:MAG: hypothetical protein V1916_02630, partial [Patescibacteria group bacterium]